MSIANNLKTLAFLSLLTMGLAACGHTGSLLTAPGDKTPTSKSKAGDASTPAQAALLASGDPHAVVTNAMMLMKTQQAYRIRSTAVMAGAGGQGTTSVMEFVAPDRRHNIDGEREVITIGKIMYVKKNGEWKNMGTQMSDMTDKMKDRVQQLSPEEKAEATKALSIGDYKSLGDEVLDGVSTGVYEMRSNFDTKQAGLPTIEMVTKYWIAKSDGLFRKEESNGTEAGMKIKTTKTYEYDPSIKIEVPIP
jgi:predicted small lipoprotein YifL